MNNEPLKIGFNVKANSEITMVRNMLTRITEQLALPKELAEQSILSSAAQVRMMSESLARRNDQADAMAMAMAGMRMIMNDTEITEESVETDLPTFTGEGALNEFPRVIMQALDVPVAIKFGSNNTMIGVDSGFAYFGSGGPSYQAAVVVPWDAPAIPIGTTVVDTDARTWIFDGKRYVEVVAPVSVPPAPPEPVEEIAVQPTGRRFRP